MASYRVVDIDSGDQIYETDSKREALAVVKKHPEWGVVHHGRYLRLGLAKDHPDYGT